MDKFVVKRKRRLEDDVEVGDDHASTRLMLDPQHTAAQSTEVCCWILHLTFLTTFLLISHLFIIYTGRYIRYIRTVPIGLCFCVFVRLRISPPRIKLATSNFARRFFGFQGRVHPILVNFGPEAPPPQTQNRTIRTNRPVRRKLTP